ncbi:MAG: NUDIX domain-containing protein [Candidatus Woesebacteria bacterium]
MGKTKRRWKKVNSKLIYQNKWIKLLEDRVVRPDGKEGIYAYMEKPVGVFSVVYDQEDGSIYLIKQHRYPIDKTILEIPGGVAESDDYEKEAKKELEEETGITAEI